MKRKELRKRKKKKIPVNRTGKSHKLKLTSSLRPHTLVPLLMCNWSPHIVSHFFSTKMLLVLITSCLVSSDDVCEMTTTISLVGQQLLNEHHLGFLWGSSRPSVFWWIIQTCDINVRGEIKTCMKSIRHYDTQYVNVFISETLLETECTQGSRHYQQYYLTHSSRETLENPPVSPSLLNG